MWPGGAPPYLDGRKPVTDCHTRENRARTRFAYAAETAEA